MDIFFKKLLQWYDKNGRKLPWRETRNPYIIWVSEVILQQTRVAQGLNYFMTFLRYFPDLKSLAKAPENEVLKVWQGLGYYSRALNMHNAAKELVENGAGKFPQDYEGIRKMKGVGDYTAAAIASIAYGLPHAAVDGNVKRVAARFFGIRSSIHSQATVKMITETLNKIIPNYKPGDFNQAMIELGALVCLPTNPKCAECPMRGGCVAFAEQMQHLIPVTQKKKTPKKRYLNFMFLEFEGDTWLLQRDKKSIWKGLYEFPCVESYNEEAANQPITLFVDYLKTPSKTVVTGHFEAVHQLTHQTIFARFWHLSGMPSNIVLKNKTFIKVASTKLNEFPVHRLMHKFLVHRGLATNE